MVTSNTPQAHRVWVEDRCVPAKPEQLGHELDGLSENGHTRAKLLLTQIRGHPNPKNEYPPPPPEMEVLSSLSLSN